MHTFILIFIFIVSRTLLFFEYGKDNEHISSNINYINQDFLELFMFNHTIPNGHLLLEKLLFHANLYSFSFFYLLNILYTALFCFFLNDVLKLINFNTTYRIIILIVASTLLIPYESWRVDHHDHINLFIISYLFWSMFRFINTSQNFNHLILALILLNFFYTLSILYSIIFFIFIIYINKKKYIKLDNYFFLKFFSVFFITLIIFSKNYLSSSIFSPTSMGGANLIQRTIHALGENKYQNLIEIKKNNFPSWWIGITEEIFQYNIKESLVDNRISNLAHGKLDNDLFLNFSKQKNIIKNYDNLENKMNNLIQKDSNNFNYKNWLYDYGYKQNLISTKYQSFGNKIFIEACKFYPMDMFFGSIGNKGIFLTSIKMISYSGLMPNYYESENRKVFIFSNHFNNLIRILILIVLILTPFVLIKKINYKTLKKIDIFYFLLLVSIFLIIFVTSTITCCENPRMLVMHFFIILLLSIMNLNYIFKFNEKLKE